MKILLAHRYFWPDSPPYANMLRSIAGRLANDGHDVTVYSTMPSYKTGAARINVPASEDMDGFSVIRAPISAERKGNVPLRLVNLLRYSWGLRRYILSNPDFEVVMASTFPPIAAGLAAGRAAKKINARFIYHCMDLHPEVSLYSGQLKRGMIFNRLQKLDACTCRSADRIVVLSEDMINTLADRPGEELQQTSIINNFQLEDFDRTKVENVPSAPQDKFIILFAGNIGNFQNLDRVIEAMHLLTDLDDVQLWLMGEGAAKKRLISLAGSLVDKSVFFLDAASHMVAQRLMEKASLNLVSLKPDIFHVSYPSKTLSILSCSGPVLAVIEPHSELAKMVVAEKIGFTAEPDDHRSIVDAIRSAYDARENDPKLRKNAKRLYDDRFARERALDRWSDLIGKPG